MDREIIKRIQNNPIMAGPGMVMKMSLFISLVLHVIIVLIFQKAFFLRWDDEETRTYRVEFMRPLEGDMTDHETPQPEITRLKEKPPPPPEESEATISLETKDQRYVPYARILKEMISRRWIYPPEAKENLLEGELMVLFSLAKGGNLTEIQIEKNSGYEILDQEAVRAIKTAAPFPPFPEQLTVSRLHVKANFEYRLTARK